LSSPGSITTGPDGALWFTEGGANKLGRITTAGAFTEFPITSGTGPGSVVLGPDGNFWFAEFNGGIGHAVLSAGGPAATPAPSSLILALSAIAASGLYGLRRRFARREQSI